MTTFAEQLASDLGIFFNDDEFAESATYNGKVITVVEAAVSERNTGSPGFASPTFGIFVKASDVARPKGGDIVTFRGVSCRVSQFASGDIGVWLVDLMKDTVQA